MDSQWLFVVRALHIVAAALWIGAGVMLTLYVMPAIRDSGAAGGTVLVEAMRRGIGVFMPSVAGLTMLSGLVLYWVWFQARGGLHGTGAILLTIGSFAGVAAAIIGGAVLGRTVNALADLALEPANDATAARSAALHERGAVASRIVVTLLLASILLMIFSHAF